MCVRVAPGIFGDLVLITSGELAFSPENKIGHCPATTPSVYTDISVEHTQNGIMGLYDCITRNERYSFPLGSNLTE